MIMLRDTVIRARCCKSQTSQGLRVTCRVKWSSATGVWVYDVLHFHKRIPDQKEGLYLGKSSIHNHKRVLKLIHAFTMGFSMNTRHYTKINADITQRFLSGDMMFSSHLPESSDWLGTLATHCVYIIDAFCVYMHQYA